jgi:two-component system KDP operon response regulator KdpE
MLWRDVPIPDLGGEMKKTNVLVVDDEVNVLRYVRACLQKDKYDVIMASDGEEALLRAEEENPMLVILDIMMPKLNGFEVCRRLREWSEVPIIMLSARADEGDKVKCLDLGADDYITKPFGADELLARVRALLRRAEAAVAVPTRPSFNSAELNISFAQRRVTMGDRELRLTPTEYNLLQELALNSGKVLTHTHLLNKVWGPEYRDETEYLHEYIRRLRNKLEPDKDNPAYIFSISGVGYRLRDEETQTERA